MVKKNRSLILLFIFIITVIVSYFSFYGLPIDFGIFSLFYYLMMPLQLGLSFGLAGFLIGKVMSASRWNYIFIWVIYILLLSGSIAYIDYIRYKSIGINSSYWSNGYFVLTSYYLPLLITSPFIGGFVAKKFSKDNSLTFVKPWFYISLTILMLIILGLYYYVSGLNTHKNYTPIEVKIRDTQRASDLNNIGQDLKLYIQDHGGILPPEITTSPQRISFKEANICKYIVESEKALLSSDHYYGINGKSFGHPDYISNCHIEYDTGYVIYKNPNTNELILEAPGKEGPDNIQVRVSLNQS